ncbi:MAG: hypothetical protein ABJC63_04620 [Gemmatimonadales bacterium]
MRKTSLITAALFAAALAPSASSAQSMREFNDSWFWGVKAGVSTFSPTLGSTHSTASYGADWLITRTRGGLYVSFDEANLSAMSAVFDPTADESFRQVRVSRLHRIGFAALAFPWQFGRVRPYAGLGLTVNVIGSATPQLSAAETSLDDCVPAYRRSTEPGGVTRNGQCAGSISQTRRLWPGVGRSEQRKLPVE